MPAPTVLIWATTWAAIGFLTGQNSCFHLPQTLFLVELEIDGNFLLVRKSMENFFGSSAQHYMLVREYNNPSIIKPMMIVKLNKTMIFFFDSKRVNYILNSPIK